MRCSIRSSIQERALAIAVSRASRSRGSRPADAGRWTTPFRRRATDGVQGMLIDRIASALAIDGSPSMAVIIVDKRVVLKTGSVLRYGREHIPESACA